MRLTGRAIRRCLMPAIRWSILFVLFYITVSNSKNVLGQGRLNLEPNKTSSAKVSPLSEGERVTKLDSETAEIAQTLRSESFNNVNKNVYEIFIQKMQNALKNRDMLRYSDDKVSSLASDAEFRARIRLLEDLARHLQRAFPIEGQKLAQEVGSLRQNPYRIFSMQDLMVHSRAAQEAVQALELRQIEHPEVYPRLQEEKTNYFLMKSAQLLPQISLNDVPYKRTQSFHKNVFNWLTTRLTYFDDKISEEEKNLLQIAQIRDNDIRIEHRLQKLKTKSTSNSKNYITHEMFYEKAEAFAEGQFRGFYPNQKVQQLAESLLDYNANFQHRIHCEAVLSLIHKVSIMHSNEETPRELEEFALSLLPFVRRQEIWQVNREVLGQLQRIEVNALPSDKLRVAQEIEQLRKLQQQVERSLNSTARRYWRNKLDRKESAYSWYHEVMKLLDQPLENILETRQGKMAHWERLELRRSNGRLPPAAAEKLRKLALDGFEEQIENFVSTFKIFYDAQVSAAIQFEAEKAGKRPSAIFDADMVFFNQAIADLEQMHKAPLWITLESCRLGIEQALDEYLKFEPERVAAMKKRLNPLLTMPRGPPSQVIEPVHSISPWVNPSLDRAYALTFVLANWNPNLLKQNFIKMMKDKNVFSSFDLKNLEQIFIQEIKHSAPILKSPKIYINKIPNRPLFNYSAKPSERDLSSARVLLIPVERPPSAADLNRRMYRDKIQEWNNERIREQPAVETMRVRARR